MKHISRLRAVDVFRGELLIALTDDGLEIVGRGKIFRLSEGKTSK